MTKINILAVAISIALVGCGGGESGGSSVGTSGGSSNTSQTLSPNSIIGSWSYDQVTNSIANVTPTPVSDADLCSTGSNHAVLETQDLKVTFDANSTSYSDAELVKVAKMSQTALDEVLDLMNVTRSELNLDTDKWVVCYDDRNQGGGSAYPNKFEFSPRTADPTHWQFNSGYKLAKHELVHVVQAELLSEENPWLHLPRFYQEAHAEIIAGKSLPFISDVRIRDYMSVAGATTPFIQDYNEENLIDTNSGGKFEDDHYELYVLSMGYFFDHGLDVDDLTQLTRDSYRAGKVTPDVSDFETAFAALESSKINADAPYTTLKATSTDYDNNIIRGWLYENAAGATYIDVIADDATSLYLFQSGESDFENSVNHGSVTTAQDEYLIVNTPVVAGTYDVYIETDNLDVYGPVSITFNGSTYPTIDMTGAPLCTTCDD